jgi:hypothetical protein
MAIDRFAASPGSFGDAEHSRDHRHPRAGIPVLDDQPLADRRPALQAVVLAGTAEKACYPWRLVRL